MLKTIHEPRLMCSNISVQKGNKFTTVKQSGNNTYSTEYWSNDPEREWVDAGVCTAKKGYTWITKWEMGKNYIVTKIIDNENNLVGYFCDITSTINEVDNHCQAFDWYLDIFVLSDSKIVILDEDELEEAVKLGYLSSTQAVIANDSLKELLVLFNSGSFNF